MANDLPAAAIRPLTPPCPHKATHPVGAPHPRPPVHPFDPLHTFRHLRPLFSYASAPYGSDCDCDCSGDSGETGDGPDAWELGGGGALLAGGVGCALGVPGGGEAGGVGRSGRDGEGFGRPP